MVERYSMGAIIFHFPPFHRISSFISFFRLRPNGEGEAETIGRKMLKVLYKFAERERFSLEPYFFLIEIEFLLDRFFTDFEDFSDCFGAQPKAQQEQQQHIVDGELWKSRPEF